MSDIAKASLVQGPVDVVVTGSAGFIGSALVRRLSTEGLTVQGVDIRAGDAPTLHVDVTDGVEVMDVLRRLRPTVVVHAAAVSSVRAPAAHYQQVNVCGTENVLNASASVGVDRFVHVSSITALGVDPGPNAGEDSPLGLDTGSPHFDTKAAGEELVHAAYADGRVPTVVIRPGDVWGPGSELWVLQPVELMRRHAPVLVAGGRGLMAHCFMDNLVDALVLAIERPEAIGGVFQIHDGVDTTTYRDYFGRLAEVASVRAPASMPRLAALALARAGELIERFTGWTRPMGTATVHYLCREATYSMESARAVLGYRPRIGLDGGMEQVKGTLVS